MTPSRAGEPLGLIACQLKLRLRPAQERMLTRWLWHLTRVYNWAIRKVQLDAKDGCYWSKYDLEALLVGHSQKLGIPSHAVVRTVRTAWISWRRCFAKLARRPRLKGNRNKLNSFAVRWVSRDARTVKLIGLGRVRFHQQEIPDGPVKSARIIRRASGWYLVLVIQAAPKPIPTIGFSEVGIDPGFKSLVTLSTGESIDHPRELLAGADRLAQAQRGTRQKLTARLQERMGRRRLDRNHKLSRRLVAENALIGWSKDSHQTIARTFGKSVASAAHGQLRQMLVTKCRTGGREFIEVSNRNSTRRCSACGALSGPQGRRQLSVRQWVCGCGAHHDRDVNAAVNTLIAARGIRDEMRREPQSGTATDAIRPSSKDPKETP